MLSREYPRDLHSGLVCSWSTSTTSQKISGKAVHRQRYSLQGYPVLPGPGQATARPPLTRRMGEEPGHDLPPSHMYQAAYHEKQAFNFDHKLHGQALATLTSAKYMGITIHREVRLDSHISATTAKARHKGSSDATSRLAPRYWWKRHTRPL